MVTMSKEELTRLEVVQRVAGKQMGLSEAARLLSLSERKIKRLMRAFRTAGATGLISKRRGQPSNNRIDAARKDQVLERMRGSYSGFGPTLAVKYLRNEGFTLLKKTLRQWMITAGLWRVRKQRGVAHPPRARRPRLGELVQIDGSPHDWFEGRGPRCTLIAFIDDATSRVMAACFTRAETTQDYLNGIRSYVSTYGCPAALYSDRHGIFTKPQAKGRVERLFQTLQDRLVKAMRLADIADIASANGFLQTYLPEHNACFAVVPAQLQDAHTPCPVDAVELARICAIWHRRKLTKDLVVSINRQRYIVQTAGAPWYALRRQTVTVAEHPDQRIELFHETKSLPFKVFDETQTIPPAVDDKTLNPRIDEILLRRSRPLPQKPPATHPWRQYPNQYRLAAAAP